MSSSSGLGLPRPVGSLGPALALGLGGWEEEVPPEPKRQEPCFFISPSPPGLLGGQTRSFLSHLTPRGPS